MNELNLKDISKETTKGPTKVMVVAIVCYQGCLQNLAKLLYHYISRLSTIAIGILLEMYVRTI